jgi:hypothetical protein
MCNAHKIHKLYILYFQLFIKMTIYFIEMNKVESWKGLPSVHEAVELCLIVITRILRHLSNAATTGQHLAMEDHIRNFHRYIGALSVIVTGRPIIVSPLGEVNIDLDTHIPIRVLMVYVEKHIALGPKIIQSFILDSLSSVPQGTLIELMSLILKNSLISLLRFNAEVSSRTAVMDYSKKLKEVINDLIFMFATPRTSSLTSIVSAKIQIEVLDGDKVTKHLYARLAYGD